MMIPRKLFGDVALFIIQKANYYRDQKAQVTFPMARKIYQSMVNANSHSRDHYDINANKENYSPSLYNFEMCNSKNETTFSNIFNKHQDSYLSSKQFRDITLLVKNNLPLTSVTQHIELCEQILFKTNQKWKFLYTCIFDHHLYERDISLFTSHEVTRMMFFVYFFGDAPDVYLQKIETHVMDNLDTYTLNDIGVVCSGFFNTDYQIRYDLCDKITKKLVNDIRSISANNFICILKSLRHSNYKRLSFYEEISDHVSKSNPSAYNFNHIMHILFFYASQRIYQKPVLDFCSNFVRNYVPLPYYRNLRTKEISRTTWSFGTFHYGDKVLYDTLLMMFRSAMNDKIVRKYPQSLCEVCTGCAYVGVYPDDLLDMLFEDKMIQTLSDQNYVMEKRYQMLLLHHSIQIEHLAYSGARIHQDKLSELPCVYTVYDNEVMQRKGLQELLEATKIVFGTSNVQCYFILPHFNIACIQIQPAKSPHQHGLRVDVLNKSKNKKIAVIVLGFNQCAVDSNYILGYGRAMIRQLELLNYSVCVVYPLEAVKIMQMSEEDRCSWVTENIVDKYICGYSHGNQANYQRQS